MQNLCPQCGAPVSANAAKCEYCGAALVQQAQPQNNAAQPQTVIYQTVNNANMNLPVKSKTVAGILALLLGGIGIHKFYLGQTGKGILYILFCWTYIPSILAFIEGLTILCGTDEKFMSKYNCRLG